MVKDLHGKTYGYRLAIVDLDPKPLANMDYWVKNDDTIVKFFIQQMIACSRKPRGPVATSPDNKATSDATSGCETNDGKAGEPIKCEAATEHVPLPRCLVANGGVDTLDLE